MIKDKKDIFIYESESIKTALKRLDKTAERILFVVDKTDKLLGTITDGDIRRYILKGNNLDDFVIEIYNRHPIYVTKGKFSIDVLKKLFIDNKIEVVPVIDDNGKVADFVAWSQVFSSTEISAIKKSEIDIPVVIMAGGKGFRLDPFTRILPKPLIPIGDKPIIEIIIDEFKKQGVREYYVTLNSKGEMIRSYFDSIVKDYEIKYIWERERFLGTAGSLKFLENKISDIFIVSNCDVIVRANFEEVLNFHKERGASLTILSCIHHHQIPYGVIQFKKGGEVIDIQEKPEYSFPINTGVYVLNKETMQFIPEDTPFDMTDLIKNLIKNNKKIAMYPVNQKDYVDIGQWEEYKMAIQKLNLFRD